LAQVWLQLDKKTEAIASLEKAIALELELEDSEELYQKAEVWVKAGDNLANSERWDEAIVHYQRAIEIEPTYHQSYQNLGIALVKVGKIEDAIGYYKKALQFQPDKIDAYSKLGVLLAQHGRVNDVIACYRQLSNIDTNSTRAYYKLGILLAEQGMIGEAVTFFQQAPQKQASEGEIYTTIWQGLNQQIPLDVANPDCQTEIQPEVAKAYFTQTSAYTIINIASLTETEKIHIESVGLSLANLELISQGNIALEEIYIKSFADSPKTDLTTKRVKQQLDEWIWNTEAFNRREFQLSIVETGYIYSVCPASGRILRSNQSVYYGGIGQMAMTMYRFVGSELFYLIVGCWSESKLAIYLPRLELIIKFHAGYDSLIIWEKVINKFKADSVSSWKQFLSYISNEIPKKLVAVTGFYSNIAHYIWNEASGILFLHEIEKIQNIESFLVAEWEYFRIEDYFPEVKPDLVIRVKDSWQLYQTILNNHYFAVRVTGLSIKKQLAARIYYGSVKRCSEDMIFKNLVEKSRQHFPLLWIIIRSHTRVWLSQVEGIANILKSLYTEYPNLGVIFDGWGKIDREDISISINHERVIESEKEIAEKIIALIPAGISTYSAIGSTNEQKVLWTNAIDLYIAPEGAGLFSVLWVANKMGVVHSNNHHIGQKGFWSNSRDKKSVEPVFLSREDIQDVPELNVHHTLQNYSCDWGIIYQEVIKILNKIKEVH
jgi:tetratricopeptide (TPR) repeat protein